MNRGDRFRRTSNVVAVRGRAPAIVGAVFSRTSGVEGLALAYDQTYADITSQLGFTPDHPWATGEGHSDVWIRDAKGNIKTDAQGHRLSKSVPEAGGNPVALQWWNASAKPVFGAWNAFKRDLIGNDLTVANDYIHWTNRMKLGGDELASWYDRLLAIREGAKLVGLRLSTPTPDAPPKTLIDNVEDVGSSVIHKVGEAWTLGKVAIYGGLALGAVLIVSSIVTNVRAGTDPARPYLQLAGRGR